MMSLCEMDRLVMFPAFAKLGEQSHPRASKPDRFSTWLMRYSGVMAKAEG
jgi:hypothetical protein